MTLAQFRKTLLAAAQKHFPQASIEVRARRTVVLEARLKVGEDTFIEVYFNALTARQSYALISEQRRLMGYDNYKYWHCHPLGRAGEHMPCPEPELESVFAEMEAVIRSL